MSNMNKPVRIFFAVIAVALVPCLLFFALSHYAGMASSSLAFWGPLAVLALDSVLFFVATGLLTLPLWDRLGISIALPMLIAMASWGLMMGMVAERMGAAG